VSRQVILDALQSGPKTTAQIAEAVGRDSTHVARICWALGQRGQAKRIDGGMGHGSVAVWSLAGDNSPMPATVRRAYTRRRRGNAVGATDFPEAQYVYRDLCPFCGVRADIGCQHLKAA
jgi:hypothetical protein